ncbi:thioesterase-like superfamily-domain-containing protein [Boeremia exigua]|uniref:thioesterase-like superfamily-domain-containing protein n=1 Tax=Boeremia exigua TaxID=749465 RepID=UPI001E8E9AE8|nr:thioesterase-like superfamily-domain-containing protein [Boeremia exigua]KAH6620581.1 thioesterase-like superfamily-domain-containing protein [Boeremia exigua]
MPIAEQFELTTISNGEYETVNPPQRMANTLNIAYGGYALATACKAATLSVDGPYHIYTVLGNYLGPASTDRPLRARVRTVRQTRSFATRQVEISQSAGEQGERICLIALVDFQIREKETLVAYSRSPSKTYTSWENCSTEADVHQKLLAEGKVSQDVLDEDSRTFGLVKNIFEYRPCPEGIFAQNVHGIAKNLALTQDELPLTQRSSADWIRCVEDLPKAMDHVALMAFTLDAFIASLPLTLNHRFLDDASACSSLDFALRIFNTDIDMARWHLREVTTNVGSEGRSYGESWLWDEDGNAVACMTQQCILRPKPKNKGRL